MTDLREPSTTPVVREPTPRPGLVMAVALFYLGFALVMSRADFILFLLPMTLVTGATLALIGWRQLTATPSFKRYIVPGLLWASWVVISSVAAWSEYPLYRGRNRAIWLAVIIPGLASLLRHRAHRRAFVGGAVAGAAVFGLVAVYRSVLGRPLFDPERGFGTSYLFGTNRNIGAAAALLVLPLVLSNDLPQRLRRVRWPLAALSAFWVVRSESRLPVVGAVVMGLVWVIIQPGAGRKFRKVCSSLLVALVVLVVIQQIGGSARVSIDRVLEGFSDDGGRNEVRRLLVRKGWHLGVQNPIFGIGLGNFAGAYHPVLEEASNTKVRRQALNSQDHNGYAGMLAETGFIGVAFMLLLFGSLLTIGITNRRSPSVRVAVSVYCFALLYMTAASFSNLTILAMTFLLATAMEAETEAPTDSTPATTRRSIA